MASTTAPTTHPQAALAYRCAIYGLIPVVGLLFGLAAVFLGGLAWWRCRQEPATRGRGHALAAILLGTLEVLTNGLGLTFIVIGLTTLQAA